MKRTTALLHLALLAAIPLTAILAPWTIAAAYAALPLFLRRRAWSSFLLIALVSSGALLAVLAPGPDAGRFGVLVWSMESWWRGVVAGTRLAGIIGANLVVLSRVPAERIIEGLRLPPRATAWCAAVTLAAHDVARDARRLVDARRVQGAWPKPRLRQAQALAALVAPLLVLSRRRAERRAEALKVIGISMPASFVPIIAVASVAAAGRLALVGLPNISLVYIVVFAGGVVYGARVGALAALLAMTFTNLVISGLHPVLFVNGPAMMAVGLLGGWFGRLRVAPDAERWLAASAGILCTIAFSLLADTFDWLLIPELRGDVAAWRARVLGGVVFNVLPAALNAVLFALSMGPLRRALSVGATTPRWAA